MTKIAFAVAIAVAGLTPLRRRSAPFQPRPKN